MSDSLFAASSGAFAGNVFFLLLCIGAFLTTMIPALIALVRGHHQTLPIAVACFFLGWASVGWVVSLAWPRRSSR